MPPLLAYKQDLNEELICDQYPDEEEGSFQ